MASGSRSGGNDNSDYVMSGNEGPTPPTPNSDVRFTAILEQLVSSNEAQLNMQAQVASILQVQSQLQAQMQTPPVPPVQQQHNVGTHVVV
ncbi:hypothetical protein AAC387_Pa05g1361 [Persea americana]